MGHEVSRSAITILKILALPTVGSQRAFSVVAHLASKGISLDSVSDAEIFAASMALWPKRIEEADFAAWQQVILAESVQLEASLKAGVRVVTFFDDAYPSLLKALANPPILLHYRGDLRPLQNQPALAMIGTRSPLSYSLKSAERIGATLVEQRIHLVSGLAEGCDLAAHLAAINAGMPTTAILGHGLQTLYPEAHRAIAEQILDNGGLLLSEYLWGTAPHRGLFVRRDRLQAGLSDATFVVETAEDGGSIHAMKEAVSLARPLFALSFTNNALENAGNRTAALKQIAGNQQFIENGAAKAIAGKNDVAAMIEMLHQCFKARDESEQMPENNEDLLAELPAKEANSTVSNKIIAPIQQGFDW